MSKDRPSTPRPERTLTKRELFGSLLLYLREQARFNQKNLSGENLAILLNQKLGKSYYRPDISEWETGRRLPSVSTFEAILELYTFQNVFKSWADAKRILQQYAQLVHLSPDMIRFSEVNFTKWQIARQLLRAHIPDNINRDTVLIGVDDMIHQHTMSLLGKPITDKSPARSISLEGRGGLGKTSLAVAIAIRLGSLGIFEGIYFMALRHTFMNPQGYAQQGQEQIEKLDDALIHLAKQLGISLDPTLPPEAKMNIIADYYHQHPIILIIDNLEQKADVEAYQPFITKLLAIESPSRLIITSRHQTNPIIPNIDDVIIMRELDKSHVHAILEKYKFNGSPQEAEQIYDEIGGNPLALRLAMNLISVWGVEKTVQQLQQRKAEMNINDLEFRNRLFDYLYDRTFSLLDEPTCDLLMDMGLNFQMDGGVSFNEIKDISDHPDLTGGLKTLIDLYLVNFEYSKNRYTMHRLIQYYIRRGFLS